MSGPVGWVSWFEWRGVVEGGRRERLEGYLSEFTSR